MSTSYSLRVLGFRRILLRVTNNSQLKFRTPAPLTSSIPFLFCLHFSTWRIDLKSVYFDSGTALIDKRASSLSTLSSSSFYSSKSIRVSSSPFRDFQTSHAIRKLRTSTPLCMGRRSSKIAGRKSAQDLKKAKLYSKIGKEVVSAVKRGGPSPVSNSILAGVIEKAKELDVPKEIVERNIKKASDKGQEAYVEKIYEVYGFGGVGMVVDALTDKVTRSVATVRQVVKDSGGKMADSGSVMFRFKRARAVNVKVGDADKDKLLAIALDAGAEDVVEPTDNEDDITDDHQESYYKIISSPEDYSAILTKLREEGIRFEPDNGMELVPITPVEVDDEAVELNKELMSKLLELEDVDAVYTDQK